jgi:hypothetical protein
LVNSRSLSELIWYGHGRARARAKTNFDVERATF